MNRRKTLLIALGALLLFGAWRSLQPLLRDEETVAPSAVLPSGPKAPRPADQLATLNLASLDRVPSGSAGGRDLWRFLDPPPSPRPAERVPTPPLVLPPPDSQPPGPAVATAPAPPALNLDYLGNFGPPERKIAVFSDGKEIYNAREGEVIGGRFLVARIGYESADLRFVEFPDVPARRVGVRRR